MLEELAEQYDKSLQFYLDSLRGSGITTRAELEELFEERFADLNSAVSIEIAAWLAAVFEVYKEGDP